MTTNKTSFGKYFDDQRDKIIKDMQNKNAQQNIEWMERYEKRQAKKQELLLLKKMTPVGPKAIFFIISSLNFFVVISSSFSFHHSDLF